MDRKTGRKGVTIEASFAEPSKSKQQIDTPGGRVTPTAESVSMPYNNPMSDVLYIGRFYRCPIFDIYIGRSLTICCMSVLNLEQLPPGIWWTQCIIVQHSVCLANW